MKDQGPGDNAQRRRGLKKSGVLVEQRKYPIAEEENPGYSRQGQHQQYFDSLHANALETLKAMLGVPAHQREDTLGDALINQK